MYRASLSAISSPGSARFIPPASPSKVCVVIAIRHLLRKKVNIKLVDVESVNTISPHVLLREGIGTNGLDTVLEVLLLDRAKLRIIVHLVEPLERTIHDHFMVT